MSVLLASHTKTDALVKSKLRRQNFNSSAFKKRNPTILAKKMKEDKKSVDTHLLHLVYNRGGGNVATSCLVLRSMEEREQTN